MTQPAESQEAPAHEALRIWFEAEKSLTYAGLSRVLNLNAATIASWCREAEPVRPSSLVHMYAIEVFCGVPVVAWLTPAESDYVEQLAEGAFLARFPRPKRPAQPDARQMCFEDLSASAPHVAAFDPEAFT